ncbi:MAG: sulfatase-like hydrolase/transferase, partial [Planctomycetes bacterium]|nr:sulfatase-like hydrolase/transferase [Planctomycetota bacterium]
FGSPHLPHEAAKEDFALYDGQKDNLRHYYGEITGIDRAMGKLRKELRALGIHENTLVWYCSDNGGVKGFSATGGRGNKGQIYEGGLRVPAVIEWPARITKPVRTDVPAGTVDIYPTLLEIVGTRPPTQRPLDGLSLVPLIDERMAARPKALGFWQYPAPGTRTPSKQVMSDLLAAQAKGDEVGDRTMLFADAAKIKRQYPTDSYEGHAAWLDWPWKLHRIESKDGTVNIELYNLTADSQESKDESARQPDRVKSMRADLDRWLASVTASLNGKDY